MSGRHTLWALSPSSGVTEASALKAAGLARREALKLLAGGAALALASCSPPKEEIVPAVDATDGLEVNKKRRYATALTLGGYARGATVITTDGRPIKVEGNPRHPFSLGATDVFAEAEILSLYDPARAQSVSGGDGPASWAAFQTALRPRLARAARQQGRGLTLVTGRTVGPTDLRLISELRARYPQMSWRRYEPVEDDAERAGALLAFGQPATVLPRLGEADVVLCLDADPLGAGPAQIANGRDFIDRRRPEKTDAPLRLYCAEPGWTLTGANADHRLPLHSAAIGDLALALARRLGLGGQAVTLPAKASRFAQAVASDLIAHRGRALVLVGRGQPAEVHALAHWINGQLHAPVTAIAPLDPHPESHAASLAGLADDLHQGRVETLIVVGCNPAYDAPAALGMAGAIGKAAFRVHAGLHEDETAALCQWRLPLSHALESWSDARALDGTASLVQPLIRPLYDTRTAAEIFAVVGGASTPSAYALVRQTWSNASPSAPPDKPFEAAWRRSLLEGVIPGAPPAPLSLGAPKPPTLQPSGGAHGFTLALSPDPCLWDGRYAPNAWLQECPKPLSHEVWGASLAVSPADARRLKLVDGDKVRLSAGGRQVETPVRIANGQAVGVVSGFIGLGRRRAGAIGSGVGVDFAPLRRPGAPWTTPVSIERVGGHDAVPAFQATRTLEGEARKLSPVIAFADLPKLAAKGLFDDPSPPSLLPPPEGPGERAWGMVIDAAACIGCSACVVACQAENNVPVVGPEEISHGRDMHWLRIDAYDLGQGDDPRPAFQPVPCMHCEHAPCEPVCPVEASVHDSEGLNVQVYNRCIGTRFCESNCPYKVRRFNFFGYADGQAYGDMGAESVKAQRNPEVTVRERGVMEKCTYCVQRISAARITAERENREIGPHEVVTACQSACPTQAIHFGDLKQPASSVSALRNDQRHYALLGELGTRPRTTYLARLKNPNPALEEDKG